MENLELWEANILTENIGYADTNDWEQTRLLMTMMANMFAKHNIDSNKILQFPWDREQKEKKTTITNEEIEQLKNKAQRIKEKKYGCSNTDKANQ